MAMLKLLVFYILCIGVVGIFFIAIVFATRTRTVKPTTVMKAEPGIGTEKNPGVVLNFKPKKDNYSDLKNIKVKGFEFVERLPRKRIKHKFKIPTVVRKYKKDLWFLDSKIGSGEIVLTDFQTEGSYKNVVVELIYHVSSYDRSGITVVGTDSRTGEVMEEMLNSVLEPSLYCKKLVFLGFVDEIKIVGFASSETEFVVLDDLKVAIGTHTYDDEEEFTCEPNKGAVSVAR